MKQNSLILPSFAKINLYLKVIGRRSDGFHELVTIFQSVSLKDEIKFTLSDTLSLKSNNQNIPVDESNLILKSAKLLQNEFDVGKGAEIFLNKNIPFPGGLGGGSSNAAVSLLGLATLWEIDTDFEKLCSLAKRLGSDVPFFLYGGTALGFGRGTKLENTKDFEEKHLIIITPKIDISTPHAFANLNAQDLTNIDSKSILKICRDEVERLLSGHLNFTNDFERSVFMIEPKIEQVKNKLLELEAKVALLSGSGASVFAIFDNKEKQQVALSAFENDNKLRKFAVETISRNDYYNFFSPCKQYLPISF